MMGNRSHTTPFRVARLAALVAIAVATIATILSSSVVEGAPTPPYYTYSFYMTSINTTSAYNWGYSQGIHDYRDLPGHQDSMVILDFGQPAIQNGIYGAFIFDQNADFVSVSDIEYAVDAFSDGFFAGLNGSDSNLTLAIGTSNLGQRVDYHSHEVAWVQAVDSVQNYITQAGYSQRLSIVGADDIELDYNTSSASFPWVQGFADANSNQRLLMDYGDSAACPQSGTTATPGACNNGWTQQTVWNAAYYFTFEFPAPEIYTPDSAQARQWQQISLWGYLALNVPIRFVSSFTQLGSCQQGHYCAPGTDNSPDTGFSQLWDAIYSDSRTAIGFSWSTDIRYES